MNKELVIKEYINMVIKSCRSINYSEIADIYNILLQTCEAGGKIYICGNGGSASTASHFQVDLNNAFSITKGIMPATCLVDNIPTLTSTSNDYSYEDVFSHQLKFLLKDKDILIAISGSGNSKNVIKAAQYAKNKGNTVIALVGFDGGKLKTMSDFSFHIPVNNMQVSEDIHMLFCHLIYTMIIKDGEKLHD